MIQKIKRGTPEQWTQTGYVLEYGQLGVSWNKDPNTQPILKIGNGVDAFDDLPEVSSSGGPSLPINIHAGTTLPSDTLGENGDIYYLYES